MIPFSAHDGRCNSFIPHYQALQGLGLKVLFDRSPRLGWCCVLITGCCKERKNFTALPSQPFAHCYRQLLASRALVLDLAVAVPEPLDGWEWCKEEDAQVPTCDSQTLCRCFRLKPPSPHSGGLLKKEHPPHNS